MTSLWNLPESSEPTQLGSDGTGVASPALKGCPPWGLSESWGLQLIKPPNYALPAHTTSFQGLSCPSSPFHPALRPKDT